MSPKNTTTVTDILKTIADDKSLVLFNTIGLSNGDIDICLSALELTRKQYYSRLSALLKAGLDVGNNYESRNSMSDIYDCQCK